MHKKTLIWLIVVVAIVSLFVIGNKMSSHEKASMTTREVALSCTTDMATQFHIHPNLSIVINGQPQVIPANIGITNGCMNPLHTHDATGKIHVESPVERDFTISDFFAVWGQTFTKDQILTSKVDDTHEIIMTVNGVRNDSYENYVVHDLDNIVIEYSAKQTAQ